jgi:hypothetical protein
MVIGDTADKLKFIYNSHKIIERFGGFKNYCSAIEKIVFQTHEELWVGDYHGCITYFQRPLSNETLPG